MRTTISNNNNVNFLVAMWMNDTLRKELFRLVVDGKFHSSEQGFVGYVGRQQASLFNGLHAMIATQIHQNKNEPLALTVNLYKKIHALCRNGIHEINSEFVGGEFTTAGQIEVGLRRLTVAGLFDLLAFAKKYPQLNASVSAMTSPVDIVTLKLKPENLTIILQTMSETLTENEEIYFAYRVTLDAQESEKIVQAIFDECNHALRHAQSDSEVIQAIANCAWELMHLHPFNDVNLRTNIVLIDLILDYYGLPPISYYDPNYLDGSSSTEFVEIMKNGMLKTLDIVCHPGDLHFGFSVTQWTPDEEKQYEKMIAPLVEQFTGVPFQNIDDASIAALGSRIRLIQTSTCSDFIINEAKLNKIGIQQFFVQRFCQPTSGSSNNNNQPHIVGSTRTSGLFHEARAQKKMKVTASQSMPDIHLSSTNSFNVGAALQRSLTLDEQALKDSILEGMDNLLLKHRSGQLSDTGLERQLRDISADVHEPIISETGITVISLAIEKKVPRSIIERLLAPMPDYLKKFTGF